MTEADLIGTLGRSRIGWTLKLISEEMTSK